MLILHDIQPSRKNNIKLNIKISENDYMLFVTVLPMDGTSELVNESLGR